MSRFEIHISDIRAFKSCRRKWAWASPLRANLEPNVPYVPFFVGRAIHHCLEMYYSEQMPFETSLARWMHNELLEMERTGALWPQEKARIDDQMALIAGILDHYYLWVTKDESRFSDQNLEFIALETSFSVPLYNTNTHHKSNKVYLAGRFDGLVRHKLDDTLWIFESKTTRSIDELVRSLDNDEQCGAYIYAAEQIYGKPVAGVLYNVMRKKIPTRPQVLQNGYLSKNKSIDTTAEVYLDAIRAQHPGIEGPDIFGFYGDIIQILLDNGNKFFARIPIRRSDLEIRELAKNIWLVALEMTRPNTPLYPTPSWLNCNFCQFRSPCLAMNAGMDINFMLQEEYRKRINAVSWRASGEFDEES